MTNQSEAREMIHSGSGRPARSFVHQRRLNWLLFIMIIVCGLHSGDNSAAIETGLIAYYPFEGSAEDISGHGKHGQIFGGVSFEKGISGRAARFDGRTGFIRILDSGVGDLGDSATLSFWYKADPGNTLSDQHRIFEKDDRSYWAFILSASGLNVSLRGAGSYGRPEAEFKLIGPSAATGRWHAIALRKAGEIVDVFVNGQRIASGKTPVKAIRTSMPTHFGYSGYWKKQFYAGLIDEARIYNRALSDAEMAQLATVPSALTTEMIVKSQVQPENSLHPVPAEKKATAVPAERGEEGSSVWMGGQWVEVDRGGCDGFDVAKTTLPVPENERCNAFSSGKVVICNADHGGCRYKSVSVRDCKGGRLMGRMYVCKPAQQRP